MTKPLDRRFGGCDGSEKKCLFAGDASRTLASFVAQSAGVSSKSQRLSCLRSYQWAPEAATRATDSDAPVRHHYRPAAQPTATIATVNQGALVAQTHGAMGNEQSCIRLGCQKRRQLTAMLTETKHQPGKSNNHRFLSSESLSAAFFLIFLLAIGVVASSGTSFKFSKEHSRQAKALLREEATGAAKLDDPLDHQDTGSKSSEEQFMKTSIRNLGNEIKLRTRGTNWQRQNQTAEQHLPTSGSIGRQDDRKADESASLASQSSDDNSNDERIDVRHKFTFTVNGRELALEPPKKLADGTTLLVDSDELLSANSTEPKASLVAAAAAGSAVATTDDETSKVNRIGEFISQDYDSGFDTIAGAGETTESNNLAVPAQSGDVTTSGQHRPLQHHQQQQQQQEYSTSPMPGNGRPSVGSGFGLSLLAPPSSSSSALMSTTASSLSLSSRFVNMAADNDERLSAAAPLSAAGADRNSIGGRSEFERHNRGEAKRRPGDDGNNDHNKIISHWPKAAGKLSQAADRHSLSTPSASASDGGGSGSGSSAGQNQGARFSTLLNSANNGGARQSGVSQHQSSSSSSKQQWDVRVEPSSSSPASAAALTKTSTERTTSPHPRAPGYAKTRSTSSLLTEDLKPLAGQEHYRSTTGNWRDGFGNQVDNDNRHLVSLAAAHRSAAAASPMANLTRAARSDRSTAAASGNLTLSKSFTDTSSLVFNAAAAAGSRPPSAHVVHDNSINGGGDEWRKTPAHYERSNSIVLLHADHHHNKQTNLNDSRRSAPMKMQKSLRNESDSSGGGDAANYQTTKQQSKSHLVTRDLSHRLQPFTSGPPIYSSSRGSPSSSSSSFGSTNSDRMPPALSASTFARIGYKTASKQPSNHFYTDSANGSSSVMLLNDSSPVAFVSHVGNTNSLSSKLSLANASAGKLAAGGERVNSIVRTGPILPPLPLGHLSPSQAQIRALMPAAMAILAQAQEDQKSRTNNQLRALLANHQQSSSFGGGGVMQQNSVSTQNNPDHQTTISGSGSSSSKSTSPSGAPVGLNPSGVQSGVVDQMVATANHLGVSHLGPLQNNLGPMSLGASESNSYNSLANLQDYQQDRGSQAESSSGGNGPESSILGGDSRQQQGGQSSSSNGLNDDQRANYGAADFQGDMQQNSGGSSTAVNNGGGGDGGGQVATTNSRSSLSDVYTMRPEHKSSDSSSSYPIRSSMGDPFEDLASGGMTASEYERDLADLDEEFSRQNSFRRPSSSSLMSESFMSLSPERYEGRYRHYNRRPLPSYDYSGEYLNAAGSMSSIIPRAYQRSPAPWSTSSAYSDSSADLWADSNVDFSPLASLVNPTSHYATYRWRPRYQRLTPGIYSSSPYLTASASEQHLQPAYNYLPSYTSALPTETISFALSPLAAAAAAAASALAAADKSRHHQNHAGWLTLPRLTTANTLSPAPPPTATAAASSAQVAHATTIPAAAALQAAYMRPNPYALSSTPIYAIAPARTAAAGAPLASAASGVAPSLYPYFHTGAAPTIIAYRPAGVMPGPASLLTAASFAYPLRLPVTTLARPNSYAGIGAPVRAFGARPFYSDLQFAETKPRSNLNGTSDGKSSGGGGGLTKAASLTAMAKNLTKKMFGSASQIRPQHVAPPPTYEATFSALQNSSTSVVQPLSI